MKKITRIVPVVLGALALASCSSDELFSNGNAVVCSAIINHQAFHSIRIGLCSDGFQALGNIILYVIGRDDDGDVHNLIPAGLNGCLTLCTASSNLTGGSCAVAAWDQEEWSCSRHISATGKHQDALHPSLVCPQREWG